MDYAQTRERVRDQLRALAAAVAPRAGAHAEALLAIGEQLDARFTIAVVGEFSSGKSFLLNALLGKVHFEASGAGRRIEGLLATDINPSTAAITELEYGAPERATAFFSDGASERVPLDGLGRFVAATEGRVPVRVEVAVDSAFLRSGFILADTPGLASIDPAHRRATLAYLPRADAVLYLIDTQTPFTEGDAAFLGVVRSHIESVFVVQTKIDLWRVPEGGDEAWESAYRRIADQLELHAPGTRLFPLSARDYAEGMLGGDEPLVERSRFRPFVEALDASLSATSGRNRLRRAAARARGLFASAAKPDAAAVGNERWRLRDERERIAREIERLGTRLREETIEALGGALDIADIARIRDRAKLHVLVDGVVARATDRFAATFARTLAEALGTDGLEAAAAAFGATAGSGTWNGELDAALRSAVVLGALGGPAVAFVHAIAARFASAPEGAYMKRELIADLRASFFAALAADVDHFVAELGAAAGRALDNVGLAFDARAARAETNAALADVPSRRDEIAERLRTIDELIVAFAPDPFAVGRAEQAARGLREHVDRVPFDREAYDRGLRPTRWRVAVLGALARGKSSLINAFAGEPVLEDDRGALAFPVHVRYGAERAAYALDAAGDWHAIGFDEAGTAARRSPVLVEVPWRLPSELVLVHAPPFDAGDPYAEEIALAVAASSQEALCLFSRQLSERELNVYERIASGGKPLLFVHTIADNETTGERRSVVELAQRYLADRRIESNRIFTISALDYRRAREAGRAPCGWNELEALRATLAGHAEEHMAYLARRERELREVEVLGTATPTPGRVPWPFGRALDRIFRRRQPKGGA